MKARTCHKKHKELKYVFADFFELFVPLVAKTRPMKQAITGFEKDDDGHWRAILECGHRQHVRHDPPLTTRDWVLTQAGRDSRLGVELDCKRCDEEPLQQ